MDTVLKDAGRNEKREERNEKREERNDIFGKAIGARMRLTKKKKIK